MTKLPEGAVTLLLGDVEGSVRLWESDPVHMPHRFPSYRSMLACVIEEHGGAVPIEQGEGDAFVAAFSRPSDALACAVDVQLRLETSPIRLRMGMHTGEVLVERENYMGRTINRCARIRDAAHGGQIVVSRSTHDLLLDVPNADVSFLDLGTFTLRDLDRPEQLFQVVHPGLRSDFPHLDTLDAKRTNIVTPLTSFVGRARELTELGELISAGTRLVTLTGPGGCGKTRLALELGLSFVPKISDGVFAADLAPISDPAQVGGRVARALGMREESAATAEELARYLAPLEALLIIDNCEHLVGEIAVLVHELLESCPRLRVVATSREPLGIAGEWAWRVPPLSISEDGDDGDAVALFYERARRVRPDFAPSEENRDAVSAICRRLDGLPLAIELAAARIRVLSCEKIADALTDRFKLLSGGARSSVRRQQTLRASLDWSFELLTGAEQVVLRRLAAFPGSLTMEAAEDVCAGDDIDRYEVLELITRLVDRSLVMAGEDRLRLLESVREYAGEQLVASGEAAETRTRHRDHYLALAERLGPQLFGDDAEAFVALHAERDNMRTALEWASDNSEWRTLSRLAVALAPYWDFAGPYEEPAMWLGRAIDADVDAPDELSARLRWGAWNIATNMGDVAQSLMHAKAGVEFARASGDGLLIARATVQLGISLMFSGELAEGRAAIELACELGSEMSDTYVRAYSLFQLATLAGATGDFASAIPLREETIALASEIGNTLLRDTATTFLALDNYLMGNLREALGFFSVAYRRSDLNKFARGYERALGATAALQVGDYKEARARAYECYEMARGVLGGRAFESIACVAVAQYHLGVDGPSAAEPWCERALELAQSHDFVWYKVAGILAAVEHALAAGSLGRARELADEAVLASSSVGLLWIEARAEHWSARVMLAEGDLRGAARLLSKVLVRQAAMPDKVAVVWSLELLASVAVLTGSFEVAARLWGAASTRAGEIGLVRVPTAGPAYEQEVSSARAGVGDEAFDRAFAEGEAMNLDQAVSFATKRRWERVRPASGWLSLTPIERQVVDLVVEGLTNPQIGEKLFISKRTVQSHLARIFPKLGVTSRSQLAAEAARVETG